MHRQERQRDLAIPAGMGGVLAHQAGLFASRMKRMSRGAPTGSTEFCLVLGLLAWFGWLTAGLAPLPQLGFLQDLGILLDSGWRYSQGQLPHRDYVSPVGPAFSLVAGLPLMIGGPHFESYQTLPLALCACFSLLSLIVTHHRIPATATCIYSIATGFVAGGTYHLGFAPELLTFATLFNRIGWAGTMVLVAAWGLPARPAHHRCRLIGDGVVSGTLLGFLLFLKVNYFAISFGMLTVAFVLFPQIRRRVNIAATTLAFSATAFCFCALIGWSIDDMARDLGYAVQARKETWLRSPYWRPGTVVMSNIGLLAWWGVLAIIVAGARGYRQLLFSAAVLTGGFLLCISNSSGNGFGAPLLVSAVLALTPCIQGVFSSTRVPWAPGVFSWGALAVVTINAIILPQIVSYGMWRRVSALDSSREIQAFRAAPKPLDRLIVGPVSCAWGQHAVEVVREAVEIIRTFVPKGSTLAVVDFTNILNFASGTKSSRGSLLWVDHHATFARRAHQPPAALLSDSDYIMIAKQSIVGSDGNASVHEWRGIYEETVKQHFELIDEGPLFIIYKKLAR
jgi:hypothetical protein